MDDNLLNCLSEESKQILKDIQNIAVSDKNELMFILALQDQALELKAKWDTIR